MSAQAIRNGVEPQVSSAIQPVLPNALSISGRNMSTPSRVAVAGETMYTATSYQTVETNKFCDGTYLAKMDKLEAIVKKYSDMIEMPSDVYLEYESLLNEISDFEEDALTYNSVRR